MRGSNVLSVGLLSFLVSGALAGSELRLQMTPKLTLTGSSGYYQIQRTEVMGGRTNWTAITNVYVSSAPLIFYDDAAIGTGQQFYRAVELTPDQINPYPLRLAWISPGTFTMGSPPTEAGRVNDEDPRTVVTLTKGFFMQKYELTQVEYEDVMGTNPAAHVALFAPVENVNWHEAVEFCVRLNAREKAAGRLPAGHEYRLPTEAEWEYACRAGTTTRFSYGDDPSYAQLPNYAWFHENAGGTTHNVGGKQPNPWGLYDMHGNVLEWCWDWYANSLPGGTVTDPTGPADGRYRVYRGGHVSNEGRYCRSACRPFNTPDIQSDYVGFRLVLAPGP
ncbi:MAG TPA: formylglycine-generating enzyme family protein [Candidatus Paceibacterota bacterium]|nr:formylglycine-generating enzyme family protein [Candidatus Paceibacterota bacterium]